MKSSIELFQSLWFKVAGEVFSVICGERGLSRHTNANETFSNFFQRFLGVCSKLLQKALMSQILHFFWWFQLRYFAYRAWCFSFFVFRLLLGGYFIKRVFADYQWEPHEKTSLSENCLFWVFLGGFMVQNRKKKQHAGPNIGGIGWLDPLHRHNQSQWARGKLIETVEKFLSSRKCWKPHKRWPGDGIRNGFVFKHVSTKKH